MATIRKRESSWHVQIRRKGLPSVTRSFSSKNTALDWARNQEVQIERQAHLGSRSINGMTLGELLARYRQQVLPRLKGKIQEESRFCLLEKEFGQTKPTAFSSHHVASYRDKRLAIVRPVTVKRELSVLSQLVNHAESDWNVILPAGNPVRRIRRPRFFNERSRRISTDEEARPRDSLSRAPVVKDIVILALETAMRRGEILGFKPADLYYE